MTDLHLSLIGVRFRIQAPDQWPRFLERLWEPAVVAEGSGGVELNITPRDRGWEIVQEEGPSIAGDDPWSLANELRHVIVKRALATSGLLGLHAAVAVREDRAQLLAGRSTAGKTTLCLALAERGWTIYSDDVAPLDPRGEVHPFPKPFGIKDVTRWSEFADLWAEEWPPPPEHIFLLPPGAFSAPAMTAPPVRVGALAFIAYDPGRTQSREDVSPGEAVVELGEYVEKVDRDAVGALVAALRGVPCVRLGYPSTEIALELMGD